LALLSCRKYKVTATSTEFVHFATRQYKPHHKKKLFVSYLVTKENGHAAAHMSYDKPQIEQLNAQYILYGKPR
jgi:hypothetical protein